MKEFIDMTKKIERKEVRISRFASLLSDAGFKAVLASPRNKKILTQLLNLVLPTNRQIAEIESHPDREVNGFTPFGKYSRVDVRCRDIEGRTFIVEMQREMHERFFQRCMWYGSNAYGSDLPVGAGYEDLSPVYVIAFLEQALPHKDETQWDSGRCVSCYQMTEKRTGEFAPDTIICIFVELGRFLKGEDELEGRFDRTCYVFKNSEKWEKDVPSKILDDEFTKELSRACEVENFPPETKLQYIRDMFTEMDYKAELKANYKNGFAAGEAQSEKKERMAAKKLLAAGVSAELVASCFGMSEKEITEFITPLINMPDFDRCKLYDVISSQMTSAWTTATRLFAASRKS